MATSKTTKKSSGTKIAVKTTGAKKPAAKKPATKKAAAKTVAVKKAPAKKVATKKVPAKKPAVKKAPAKATTKPAAKPTVKAAPKPAPKATPKPTNKKRSNPNTHLVKRAGHTEPYDERKLYASVYASCLAVRETDEAAELLADKVCKEVHVWLEKRREVTAHDIHLVAGRALKAYNPDAGQIYIHHKNIS